MPGILRLGVLANEVLDPGISGVGGFGYAALSVPRFFSSRPELGVNGTVVACERLGATGSFVTADNGVRVLLRQPSDEAWLSMVRQESFDLLLSIDYRPSYDAVFAALPRVPTIVWVRDPRTWDDRAHVATLRVPGRTSEPVAGVDYIPTQRFRRIGIRSLLRRRPLAVGYTYSDLASKFRRAYGMPAWFPSGVLPNILDAPGGPIVKSDTPLVVFLGRLDPIKRPWIAVEIARAMPDIRVAILGQGHFADAWDIGTLPLNLEFVGHVSGLEKANWLARAWCLVNSSIHESLPVSFLEALAYEVPIVSSENPDGLASSFGTHVPMADGDGMQSVPAFVAGVRRLVDDRSRAEALGRAGRKWVVEHHGPEAFLRAWNTTCVRLGVGLPNRPGDLPDRV